MWVFLPEDQFGGYRVHCMLISVLQRDYIIDLASSDGTEVNQRFVRQSSQRGVQDCSGRVLPLFWSRLNVRYQ